MARILLIDDSPVQLLCMSRVLQSLKHEVVCQLYLPQTLQDIDPDQVDLVLVELLMLEGNGFEVGLLLLEAGHRKVLLLTGVHRETDEIWARRLGIAGVVVRPMAQQQLQDRINAALAEKIVDQ